MRSGKKGPSKPDDEGWKDYSGKPVRRMHGQDATKKELPKTSKKDSPKTTVKEAPKLETPGEMRSGNKGPSKPEDKGWKDHRGKPVRRMHGQDATKKEPPKTSKKDSPKTTMKETPSEEKVTEKRDGRPTTRNPHGTEPERRRESSSRGRIPIIKDQVLKSKVFIEGMRIGEYLYTRIDHMKLSVRKDICKNLKDYVELSQFVYLKNGERVEDSKNADCLRIPLKSVYDRNGNQLWIQCIPFVHDEEHLLTGKYQWFAKTIETLFSLDVFVSPQHIEEFKRFAEENEEKSALDIRSLIAKGYAQKKLWKQQLLVPCGIKVKDGLDVYLACRKNDGLGDGEYKWISDQLAVFDSPHFRPSSLSFQHTKTGRLERTITELKTHDSLKEFLKNGDYGIFEEFFNQISLIHRTTDSSHSFQVIRGMVYVLQDRIKYLISLLNDSDQKRVTTNNRLDTYVVDEGFKFLINGNETSEDSADTLRIATTLRNRNGQPIFIWCLRSDPEFKYPWFAKLFDVELRLSRPVMESKEHQSVEPKKWFEDSEQRLPLDEEPIYTPYELRRLVAPDDESCLDQFMCNGEIFVKGATISKKLLPLLAGINRRIVRTKLESFIEKDCVYYKGQQLGTKDESDTLEIYTSLKDESNKPIRMWCARAEPGYGYQWEVKLFSQLHLPFVFPEHVVVFRELAGENYKYFSVHDVLSIIQDNYDRRIPMKGQYKCLEKDADHLLVPCGVPDSNSAEIFVQCVRNKKKKGFEWKSDRQCQGFISKNFKFYCLHQSQWLLNWAYLSIKTEDGMTLPLEKVLETLSKKAIDEDWSVVKCNTYPFPVLLNYLQYTFCRIWRLSRKRNEQGEEYFVRDKERGFVAFNTGLVDRKTWDFIYAFFMKNPIPDKQKWKLVDFYTENEKLPQYTGCKGKTIKEVFGKLPYPARYFYPQEPVHFCFHNPLDPLEQPYVTIDFEKFILEQFYHLPLGFLHQRWSCLRKYKSQKDLKNNIYEARKEIEGCPVTLKNFTEEFKQMVKTSLKRAVWDNRIVVPYYYPSSNETSFLVPIYFDKTRACAAIAFQRIPIYAQSLTVQPMMVQPIMVQPMPGQPMMVQPMMSQPMMVQQQYIDHYEYHARSIISLEDAYKCVRLVCRPDCDWLNKKGLAFR